MRLLPLTVLVVPLLAACTIGTRGEGLFRNLQARGTTTHVRVGEVRATGELMEVRAADMLVLVQRRLTVVPYERIREARFERSGVVLQGKPPSTGELEQLRLLSRYPYGLTPEQMRELLDTLGQDAPSELQE